MLSENAFNIWPEKSTVILHNTSYQYPHKNLFKLDIPIKISYKYLGIIINNKLLWIDYMSCIKIKSKSSINLLNWVTNGRLIHKLPYILIRHSSARSIIYQFCMGQQQLSISKNLRAVQRIENKHKSIQVFSSTSLIYFGTITSENKMAIFVFKKLQNRNIFVLLFIIILINNNIFQEFSHQSP